MPPHQLGVQAVLQIGKTRAKIMKKILTLDNGSVLYASLTTMLNRLLVKLFNNINLSICVGTR